MKEDLRKKRDECEITVSELTNLCLSMNRQWHDLSDEVDAMIHGRIKVDDKTFREAVEKAHHLGDALATTGAELERSLAILRGLEAELSFDDQLQEL